MFFEIGVLENFSMSAIALVFDSLFNKAGGLKTCIFIKKEIPTQVFSCEYCGIFKNSFLLEHSLFIILLCDDRILWTSLGARLTCFMFLVLLLWNSSVRIRAPYPANIRLGENVLKTSWRRLEDVFSVKFFCLPRRLEDIISRRLANTSWRRLGRRLEDVFKTSLRRLARRLEDVLGRRITNTSSRRL